MPLAVTVKDATHETAEPSPTVPDSVTVCCPADSIASADRGQAIEIAPPSL
ncbi:hypothetical protein [Cryobacterium sp. Hh38]|uniref:hypothetical protein n=1 Tax=Cryobacterium sp. Hh38 TaxID=1259156 RepID=UPI00141AA9A6|nr:hypothetical protein [Cryobacterium sp. Hh38]